MTHKERKHPKVVKCTTCRKRFKVKIAINERNMAGSKWTGIRIFTGTKDQYLLCPWCGESFKRVESGKDFYCGFKKLEIIESYKDASLEVPETLEAKEKQMHPTPESLGLKVTKTPKQEEEYLVTQGKHVYHKEKETILKEKLQSDILTAPIEEVMKLLRE